MENSDPETDALYISTHAEFYQRLAINAFLAKAWGCKVYEVDDIEEAAADEATREVKL